MQYTAKNIPDTEREFSWTQRGKTEGVGTHHRQGRSRGCKRWHDRVACELRRGAAARTLEGGEREGGGDQGKRWGKWRDIKKAERERRGELRQRLRLLNNLWGVQYIARGLCPPGLNSSSSSLTPYLPPSWSSGPAFSLTRVLPSPVAPSNCKCFWGVGWYAIQLVKLSCLARRSLNLPQGLLSQVDSGL